MPDSWSRRWVKFYRETSSKWRALPLSARGLGAELLRVVDASGKLYVGSERPTEALARLLGAHPSERRRLALDYEALLADGYLVSSGDWIEIVNFRAAQEAVSESTKRVREHRAARSSGQGTLPGLSGQGPAKVGSLRGQGPVITQCVNCKKLGKTCVLCELAGVTETAIENREDKEAEVTPKPPLKGVVLSTQIDNAQKGPGKALVASEATDGAAAGETSPEGASKRDGEASRSQGHAQASVRRVFDHWTLVMGKKKSVLDPKRQALISAAIKRHGEEDCCRAIDGCASDPWSMGQNERNRRYDSIELILRDSAHVERYRDLYDAPRGKASVGSDFDGSRDAAAFDKAIEKLSD